MPSLPHKEDDELSLRHRRFIDEYIIDLNGAHAARRAGFTGKNPANTACWLLQQPNIQRELRKRIAERAARTRITADRVLKEYARIAFADIRSYTEWNSKGMKLRDANELSADDTAAIAELSSSGGNSPRTRIKLHDKKRALKSIARHLGLFSTRHAGDPEARDQEATRAREVLEQKIAELAKRK